MNIEIETKDYPNETYSRVLLGEHLFVLYPIMNGLYIGDAMSQLF